MNKVFIASLVSVNLFASSYLLVDALDQNDTDVLQENTTIFTNQEDDIIRNDNEDSTKYIVSQFYRGLYGREVDEDGLTYWSNEIKSRNRTVANVFETFTESNEFKNKNYLNSDYVKSIYKGLLGREPDNDGLNFWVSELDLGESRRVILSKIYNSTEVTDFFTSLNISNIGNIEISNSDNNGKIKYLISQFYEGFYKREVDEDGLDYWATQIIDNKISIADMIVNFINAEEFKAINNNNEEYVNSLYRALLGRDADLEGLRFWTDELNSGQSIKYVLFHIFNDSEFQSKLNKISVSNRGNIKLELDDNRGRVNNLINQLYKGFYGREVDEDGKNYWSSQIISGGRSIANILEHFINSDEFKNKNYSSKEYITSVYMALFDREIDEDGLNYWMSLLERGNSMKFVLAKNMNSNEFQNKLDSIGITNKGKIELDVFDRKGEVNTIVQQLYKGFYNRESDKDGINYWVEQIINKNKTVAQVVLDFVDSSEFKSKNYSGEEYVKVLYRALQGREADINGLNHWLGELSNGKTPRYVLSNIFKSSEFQTTLKEIGIINIGEISLSSSDTHETVAKARVKASKLNFREEPSTNSNVIMQLSSGDIITITGRIKGNIAFYKAQYVTNGKIYNGYVSTDLVDIYQDNVYNEFLGVLSEKYESDGDPGKISDIKGDHGGKSYGVWQFSSKMGSLKSFVDWSKDRNLSIYKKLQDAISLDGGQIAGVKFDEAWVNIATEQYNTFYALQQAYVKENNYDVLVNRLLRAGNFSNVLSSFAVRNVLWSTVVQHGVTGAYNIISPLKNITDPESFISAVYAERGRKDENGVLVYFRSSSPAVQASVANRFINEEKEALRVHRYGL